MEELHLLPALPSAWPKGQITGLCARGAVEVDIAWSAGKLVSAKLRSTHEGVHVVRYGVETVKVELRVGRAVGISRSSFKNGRA